MKNVHYALFLLVAFAPSVAISQSDYSGADDYPRGYPRAYLGSPPGYGGEYHSSTIQEGVFRGLGSLIRSRGAANLLNSEAAKNLTEAQRNAIANRAYATQAYFDMRQANQAAREEARGPRPTEGDIERYAQMRKPPQLSVNQLDPLTGEIAWPLILKEPEYAEPRARLESLYGIRAQRGSLTIDQIQRVREAADQMANILQSNIDNYPPEAYVQAKKLVDGLSNEVMTQYQ